MELKNLVKIFADNQCKQIYVKTLAANDNSKNQVYFGGSFSVLNILPIKDIVADDSGDWKKTRFKSKIDFHWTSDEGDLSVAPNAQLILYPKYPEVRFSGFLSGCRNAPSDLMANRIENRLLFIGITSSGRIIGYVAHPESQIAQEFNTLTELEEFGVFTVLPVSQETSPANSKIKLLSELKRINNLGWIDSKRFDKERNIVPCSSSNCGGYTLETELGITPNGFSEPDYLGWEVKQFAVTAFNKLNSSIVTLMTPEPTHGVYVSDGVETFIRKYGYPDKLGRESRMNFGGIHKVGQKHKTTELTMVINGFDNQSRKITDSQGFIGLMDDKANIAASWSFASLIKHWNTKHALACYVPSLIRKKQNGAYTQQYSYGDKVMLGSHTDFSFFLYQFSIGNIYYDPGIKLEMAIAGKRKQNIKRRSQFRIKSLNLINLYKENEIVDINNYSINP